MEASLVVVLLDLNFGFELKCLVLLTITFLESNTYVTKICIDVF